MDSQRLLSSLTETQVADPTWPPLSKMESVKLGTTLCRLVLKYRQQPGTGKNEGTAEIQKGKETG